MGNHPQTTQIDINQVYAHQSSNPDVDLAAQLLYKSYGGFSSKVVLSFRYC